MEQEQPHPPTQRFAWIAFACMGLLFLGHELLERGDVIYLTWAGIALLVPGILLAIPPLFTLRKYGRVEAGKSYMYTTAVVDHDLFNLVRHPQYLGYMLIATGLTLISQHPIVIALGLATVVFFYLHTLKEERYLLDKFGRAYQDYMLRVPRFNLVLGALRYLRERILVR